MFAAASKGSSCGVAANSHSLHAVSPVLRPRLRSRCSASTLPSPVSQEVLAWATGQPVEQLSCRIAWLASPNRVGRGLVAIEPIAPDQTILSVPFTRIYSSSPEDELQDAGLHWSADMALRLLQDRAACTAQQKTDNNPWCTWLAALPRHVVTPLEFTASQLAALGDEDVAGQAHEMQACIAASFDALQDELHAVGATWTDFRDAVQVLHSRCFYLPETGRHIAVPGVDMANHSAAPTARVHITHSPGAVQGWAALEDVADTATLADLAAEPSRLDLVAGPQGVQPGQEVTISYGPWPDAAFLLLFGFLPEPNPHNSVVVFDSVADVARAVWRECCAAAGVQAAEPTALQPGMLPDEAAKLERLVVTAHGWDGRMEDAVRCACGALLADGALDAATGRVIAGVNKHMAHPSAWLVPSILRTACTDRLAALQARLHAHTEVPTADTAHTLLAAEFRSRQQWVVRTALTALDSLLNEQHVKR